ncbi:MAG: helix-turn-helix domain-containing protein [Planctomycetaceae bacterium]|nr:helix-turn-helix domain-containing protein [Planctomycetaceae bacterium]
MSIGQWNATNDHAVESHDTSSADTSLPSNPVVEPVAAAAHQPMQRLAAVRRMQGLSRRAVARRLNVEVDEIRRQESETADLPLSIIYAWQKAMDVPLAELLVEGDDASTSPILRRAQLVRLMKTVLAVRDQAKQDSIRRMAETMWEQLVEIMPELAHINPWHAVGKRRRLSELGIAAHRHLTENVFLDRPD